MIAMLADLARDDLGVYSVALVFLGACIGMAFLAICLAWDRAGERLDQMIAAEPTRPSSSNRKAGRTR